MSIHFFPLPLFHGNRKSRRQHCEKSTSKQMFSEMRDTEKQLRLNEISAIEISNPDPYCRHQIATAMSSFNTMLRWDLVLAPLWMLTWLFFIGCSSFRPATNYSAGASPVGVAIVDVNGDESLDIAIANRNGQSIFAYLNSGTGRFLIPVNYTATTCPRDVGVADVNNDGERNMMVIHSLSTSLYVFINTCTGAFLPAAIYSSIN